MNTQYARRNTLYIMVVSTAFILSGCVVRTYSVVKDRVDQDVTAGNRGFIKGKPSAEEMAARRSTRNTHTVEIELHSPLKFEARYKVPAQPKTEAQGEEQIETNQGTEVKEGMSFKKYTVMKGDTLQKISQKFYGTTKKWTKIFEANRDTLKGPNKLYPGKAINIPVESLKETKQNLK